MISSVVMHKLIQCPQLVVRSSPVESDVCVWPCIIMPTMTFIKR